VFDAAPGETRTQRGGTGLQPNDNRMSGPPARVDAVTLEARAAALFGRAVRGAALEAARRLTVACLDLTTLEGTDTPETVRSLCVRGRASGVAAVCVYPALVAAAVESLRSSGVRVAAVAGAFPSGHSTLSVKLADLRSALDAGADEVDVVLDRGAFLAGRYGEVSAQLEALRAESAGATLKVIVEAGELGSYAALRRACDLALAAGADFIKTATGKIATSTTPAIALAMCDAIRAHRRATGRSAGLKLAGGIRNARTAFGYLAIVKESLGDEWLQPARLRFGASRLLEELAATA
jgi:deoxyribose-phosphate aldolase